MFSLFRHAAVDFAADAPKSVNIPAGGMVNELILDLSAQPTLTAANNTAAKAERGDLWGVISKLRFAGEGALPIVDLPGEVLPMISYFFDYGIPLEPQPTFGDAATANPSLRQTLIIPQWSTRSGKPFDSALDNTAEPNGYTLTIDWGNYDDINGDATAFTTNPALNVYTLESKANDHPFLRKRRYFAQQTFAATGRQRLQLEPGSQYRRFLINTRDNADADATTRFNTTDLYIGGQLRQTVSESVLRQKMRLRAGLDWQANSTNIVDLVDNSGGVASDTLADMPAAYTEVTHAAHVASLAAKINTLAGIARRRRFFANTIENLSAWYLWEQAVDGYLSHNADTAQRQGNYLEFDIATANTTVCVVYEVYDDLRRPEFQTRPVRAA